MNGQSFGLVIEEAIGRKRRAKIHDEIVYGPVPRIHRVGFVLQSFIDALDDVSFPQHDFLPHGHEFVLQVRLDAVHKMNTFIKEEMEELLLDIASVGKRYSRTFAECIQPHEKHHLEEHARHEFYETIVGDGGGKLRFKKELSYPIQPAQPPQKSYPLCRKSYPLSFHSYPLLSPA